MGEDEEIQVVVEVVALRSAQNAALATPVSASEHNGRQSGWPDGVDVLGDEGERTVQEACHRFAGQAGIAVVEFHLGVSDDAAPSSGGGVSE